MRLKLDSERFFFDVDGAKPRPNGPWLVYAARSAARVGSIRLLAGEEDPSCTLAGAEELAEALPQELLEFRRYANAGHAVVRDRRDALEDVARFVAS